MEGMSWSLFEWRAGEQNYSFEIDRGGLYATLKVPQRPDLTLPMAAWDGLIEAIKTSHKARARTQAELPPRAGARWSDSETADLRRAFAEGKSVVELARSHARSRAAIESHLVRLGLMERPQMSMRAPVPPPHDGRGVRFYGG